MTATVSHTAELGSGEDATLAWLVETLTGMAGVADSGPAESPAVLVDQIAVLEKLKAAAAAAQCTKMVQFAQGQVAAQKAANVDYRKVGRGIAEQIALCCKVGPTAGARRLEMARVLRSDLPGCRELLVRGEISEHVASLVVSETSHLDASVRQLVDQQLVTARLHTLGPCEAAATARRFAYRADPRGSLDRGRKARRDRRVTCRPAPDTMSHLSAFLPAEQGVACLASLIRRADALRAAGDPRSRDQIIADTLVERVTGQATADTVDAEVQFTMPASGLIDPDDPAPADLAGYGPIPGWLAQDLLGGDGRRWWRRLFTAPAAGGATIVGGDPTRRCFDGWLGKLIRLRDRHCAEPFCGAPIRHLDHLTPYRDGGPTAYLNGRGVCERHNYAREAPGWRVTRLDETTIVTTTPTGHTYLSRAPDPP